MRSIPLSSSSHHHQSYFDVLSERMASSSRRNRNRTVAAIGGAIALAGLGYYAFSTFISSGNESNKDNGSSSSIASKKKGLRPSLSLSIPPTFIHSPGNLNFLKSLLTTLSANYVITLILPPLVESSDFHHDNLDRINELFGSIEGFDARRVLEYGKEEGRLSLARALACDAHCEVMFEMIETNDSNGNMALFEDEMDEDNDTVDGDKTPRASSPVPQLRTSIHGNTITASAQAIQDDQSLSNALEKYHAEVARIRKSSGLLIFLVLPIAKSKSRSHMNGNSHTNGISSLDIGIWSLKPESVLKPFLMAGQRDLSARVPGVKIIDGRIAEQKPQKKQVTKIQQNTSIPKAWSDAAQRLAHFSNGWS